MEHFCWNISSAKYYEYSGPVYKLQFICEIILNYRLLRKYGFIIDDRLTFMGQVNCQIDNRMIAHTHQRTEIWKLTSEPKSIIFGVRFLYFICRWIPNSWIKITIDEPALRVLGLGRFNLCVKRALGAYLIWQLVRQIWWILIM